MGISLGGGGVREGFLQERVRSELNIEVESPEKKILRAQVGSTESNEVGSPNRPSGFQPGHRGKAVSRMLVVSGLYIPPPGAAQASGGDPAKTVGCDVHGACHPGLRGSLGPMQGGKGAGVGKAGPRARLPGGLGHSETSAGVVTCLPQLRVHPRTG